MFVATKDYVSQTVWASLVKDYLTHFIDLMHFINIYFIAYFAEYFIENKNII